MCHRPTIREIQLATCAEFGISMRDMLSKSRNAKIVTPRQIAMMLSRKMTNHSFPIIGKLFYRDHTTVLHGVRQYSDVRDETLRTRIAAIAGRVEVAYWGA